MRGVQRSEGKREDRTACGEPNASGGGSLSWQGSLGTCTLSRQGRGRQPQGWLSALAGMEG